MIIGTLIHLWYLFLSFMFSLLPDASTTPSDIESGLAFLIKYIYGWDWILPVSDSVIILSWTFLIFYGVFAYKSIMLVVSLIRGSGRPDQQIR